MADDYEIVFTIRDMCAENFGPLFKARTMGAGRRAYRNLTAGVPDKTDFRLYRVGVFNSVDGTLVAEDPLLVEAVQEEKVE